jgi:hypothetical protein
MGIVDSCRVPLILLNMINIYDPLLKPNRQAL